jgi:hypothetical protein
MSNKRPNIARDNLFDRSDEVRRRIAERAYFFSENRHFEPGHELEDWLEAELHEELDPNIGYPVAGFQS